MEYINIFIAILAFAAIVITVGAYTKSRTRMGKLRLIFVLVLISVFVALVYFTVTPWDQKVFADPALYQPEIYSRFIAIFLLAFFIPRAIAAWKKEGFGNLNTYLERGLKNQLPKGLKYGAFFGFFGWGIFGLNGLLIGGLIAGILGMLIDGWPDEFRDWPPSSN